MTGRHDPGDPGAGDPRISQVVYALRDLGVQGQATAIDVLAAAGGAGLTPAQTAAVLAGIRAPEPAPTDEPADPNWLRPVGPYYVPPGQRGEDD